MPEKNVVEKSDFDKVVDKVLWNIKYYEDKVTSYKLMLEKLKQDPDLVDLIKPML